MEKFYSQAGQDEWVVNFFDRKKNGFFLDIGAYDGVNLSNSFYLEKNLDWNGICIEADPKTFQTLQNNRRCLCINVAVSDSKSKISFKQDGLVGKISENFYDTIQVNANTLDNILEENYAPDIIDYMSIDIEGYEEKALSRFPFDKKTVILMTVEHNLYNQGPSNKEHIKNILLNNGYSLYVENVKHQNLEFEDWYINNKYK